MYPRSAPVSLGAAQASPVGSPLLGTLVVSAHLCWDGACLSLASCHIPQGAGSPDLPSEAVRLGLARRVQAEDSRLPWWPRDDGDIQGIMVGGLSDLCPISTRPLGKGPSPSAPPQGSSSSCSVASFLAFSMGGGDGGRAGAGGRVFGLGWPCCYYVNTFQGRFLTEKLRA